MSWSLILFISVNNERVFGFMENFVSFCYYLSNPCCFQTIDNQVIASLQAHPKNTRSTSWFELRQINEISAAAGSVIVKTPSLLKGGINFFHNCNSWGRRGVGKFLLERWGFTICYLF